MKKILLISAVVLSLVGASGCSTNSASTSDKSTKSSKTVQKKHWDKKKDQKLAKEMKDYGKKNNQTYTKYDGKTKLTNSASRIYPDAFKKDTFKLNGKKISIGWSPQGEHHYDYDVLAIYNHDLTKDGQHKTFLFCWHKQKPIVLVDEAGKGNVVDLHVSGDKSLNGSFSNIMYGENI